MPKATQLRNGDSKEKSSSSAFHLCICSCPNPTFPVSILWFPGSNEKKWCPCVRQPSLHSPRKHVDTHAHTPPPLPRAHVCMHTHHTCTGTCIHTPVIPHTHHHTHCTHIPHTHHHHCSYTIRMCACAQTPPPVHTHTHTHSQAHTHTHTVSHS